MLNMLSSGPFDSDWWAWLGNFVEPSNYCERRSALDPHALLAEPVNAFSNVAFLVAAFAVWNLLRSVPDAQPRGQLRALVVILVFVGLGSFLFHTVGREGANIGDVIPIGAYVALFLWIFMTQFFGLSVPVKIGILVLILGSGEILDSNLFLGSDAFGGGALYIPILLALFVAAIALYRKDRVAGMAMFVAALVWGVSLTARSLDSFTLPLVTYAEEAPTPEASATTIGVSQNSDDPKNRRFDYSVCNPMSEDGYKAAVGERLVQGKNGIYHRYSYYPYHLGTHFLWHITNAIVLYLFASILILYGPKTSRSR